MKKHIVDTLKPLASEFNLSFSAFSEQISEPVSSYGKLTIGSTSGGGLQPAPTTPTTKDAAPYQLLAGTIRAAYAAHRGEDDEVIVSPGIMSGNTGELNHKTTHVLPMGLNTTPTFQDTDPYWNLTSHIFRYNHHFTGNASLTDSIHTINECTSYILERISCSKQRELIVCDTVIEVDAYIEMIKFFTLLILNADESRAL